MSNSFNVVYSLFLLFFYTSQFTPLFCCPQFVETYTDFKKNHIDDEIGYTYHYHIDHEPTNLQINHREERRGTYVHGQYGLLEPDGSVRQVHYEVDKRRGSGFHAVIETRTAYSRVLQRLYANGRNQPEEPFQHAELIANVA